MNGDQIVAVGTLAAMAAVGVAILYTLFHLARGAVRWISGPAVAPHPDPAPRRTGPLDPTVTAADLVAIRSNVLAVVRQIEDLERRIRLGSIPVHQPGAKPQSEVQAKPVSA